VARTYAVVRDVPATWGVYLLGAQAEEELPSGLLLRAAGPTDEGFRVIDVWESRADWEHARERQPAGPGSPVGSLEEHSVLRDFEVHDLYLTGSRRVPLAPARPEPGA
jgi:hypothetical protein